MDYEKAYNEAIERAKSWAKGEHPECFSEAQKAVDFIFPELKESEDERIRKEIIDFVKRIDFTKEKSKKWIAWLEKQGEQKPADKVEPSTFRDKLLELFQRFRWSCKDQIPTNGEILEYVDAHIQELISIMQKPAWSEEDEKMVSGLISIVEGWYNNQSEEEKEYYGDCGYVNFLKSLKDRVQPKQEWSEEDEKKLRDVIRLVEQGAPVQSIRDHYTNWLKSLKPNHWKPSEEQMDALLYALGRGGIYNLEALTKLYNNLKTI